MTSFEDFGVFLDDGAVSIPMLFVGEISSGDLEGESACFGGTGGEVITEEPDDESCLGNTGNSCLGNTGNSCLGNTDNSS